MGVSSHPHPPTQLVSEYEFHEALRRRHEHHLHPRHALHNPWLRRVLAAALLLAVGFGSYFYAQRRGESRLTELRREQHPVLAEQQQALSRLTSQLQREERALQRSGAELNTLLTRSSANQANADGTLAGTSSLTYELETIDGRLIELRSTLGALGANREALATELGVLRTERDELQERRGRLQFQLRQASSRLEDAHVAQRSEEELQRLREGES